MKFDRRQLMVYAVTDRAWTGKMSLCEQVEAALKGGATMVQMREKGLTNDTVQDYLEEARSLRALTERYKVPLIIDDNIKLALLCGADGVHVGQNDMDAAQARALLGQEQGADYLGSGAVFGTSTKADALPMTMERLGEICRSVSIPVVAIGGICLENIGKLKGSGAAGAAVVSGIFGAEDIEGTVRQMREMVGEWGRHCP